jgi:hypothetical protein
MTEPDLADFSPTNVTPFTPEVLPTGMTATVAPILSADSMSYPRTGDSPLWTITLGMISAGLLVLVGILWTTASLRSSTIQQNKSRTERIEASYAARQVQLNEAKAVNVRLQRQLDETKAVISQLYASLDRSWAETDGLQVELGQFRARSADFSFPAAEASSNPSKRQPQVVLAQASTPFEQAQFSTKAGLAQTLGYLTDAQTQAAELMTRLDNATRDVARLQAQPAGQ